jgi:hypothetical protein
VASDGPTGDNKMNEQSTAIYLAEQAEKNKASEYSISIAAELRRLAAIEQQYEAITQQEKTA